MKKLMTLCAILLCNQLYAVGGESAKQTWKDSFSAALTTADEAYKAAYKIRQPLIIKDTPYQRFYLLHVAAGKGHEKAIKDLKYTAELLNNYHSNAIAIWGGSEEANQNIRALLAQYSDQIDPIAYAHYRAADQIKSAGKMMVPLSYDYYLNLHLAAEAGHKKAAKELKKTAKLIDSSNSIWGGSAEANQNIRALLAQYLDYIDPTVEENPQIADEHYQAAQQVHQEKLSAILQEKKEHYAATGNHIYNEANFVHYYPYEYFLNLHQASQAGHKQAAYILRSDAKTIKQSWAKNKVFGGSEEANQNIRAILTQYK